MDYKKITDFLNKNNIPTPSKARAYANCKVTESWNKQHIYRILKDRRYIGDYIAGKTEKISFKSKKIRLKSENEWVIIKNHHAPIISEYLFYNVNENIDRMT